MMPLLAFCRATSNGWFERLYRGVDGARARRGIEKRDLGDADEVERVAFGSGAGFSRFT
jgi:hypothetical protein